MIAFSCSTDVASFVRPAVLVVDGVRVSAHDPRLDGEIRAWEPAGRAQPSRDDIVGAVRAMYRRFGVDPTKTRPSSEALLRRLRKGESLPRVNTLVDVGNWCSAETQLPYGLYDAGRVNGAIELRLGREGEEYAGIRKDVVHVAGRLVLADADGPFGNPTSDSARTMVTEATTRVLAAIFAPASLPHEVVDRALVVTRHRVLAFAGGEVLFEQR